MRKVIGQCSQGDFAAIEHLSDILEEPDKLDVSTLSNTQRFAFQFLQIAIRKGIDWNLMREVVKEVLFWGEGDKATLIKIRFKQDTNKKFIGKVLTFRDLWKGGI